MSHRHANRPICCQQLLVPGDCSLCQLDKNWSHTLICYIWILYFFFFPSGLQGFVGQAETLLVQSSASASLGMSCWGTSCCFWPWRRLSLQSVLSPDCLASAFLSTSAAVWWSALGVLLSFCSLFLGTQNILTPQPVTVCPLLSLYGGLIPPWRVKTSVFRDNAVGELTWIIEGPRHQDGCFSLLDILKMESNEVQAGLKVPVWLRMSSDFCPSCRNLLRASIDTTLGWQS